jgi:hypothetical protein
MQTIEAAKQEAIATQKRMLRSSKSAIVLAFLRTISHPKILAPEPLLRRILLPEKRQN